MKEVKESQKQKEVTHNSMVEQPNPQEERVYSLLSFTGSKGTTIVKNQNETLENILPNNAKIRITYTGKKLNRTFLIKDKANKKHKHNLIY